MRFLAAVLTFQHHIPQAPLTYTSWCQLRYDILAAFFPTERSCHHLLTVACLRSDQQQTVLRLTLAEEPQGCVYSHILHRIHSKMPIHLCHCDVQISVFDISDPAWTGISTWADFQSAPDAPLFRFVFVTPLITASPLTKECPDGLPFPEPETVFLPALERWKDLAGPPFPWSGAHILQAARCVLANYHLHTVAISSPPLPIIGYLGWVEYSCLHPQAAEVAALAALARMMFFTGCGYETIFGFGTTRAVLRKREV